MRKTDDEDNEYAGKGFLAAERIAVDGRIPTPADTCGAGTSRFKHRLVANIPRVTSLYGKEMRGQFGVDVKMDSFSLATTSTLWRRRSKHTTSTGTRVGRSMVSR
jgi:hypothetical protein